MKKRKKKSAEEKKNRNVCVYLSVVFITLGTRYTVSVLPLSRCYACCGRLVNHETRDIRTDEMVGAMLGIVSII